MKIRESVFEPHFLTICEKRSNTDLGLIFDLLKKRPSKIKLPRRQDFKFSESVISKMSEKLNLRIILKKYGSFQERFSRIIDFIAV